MNIVYEKYFLQKKKHPVQKKKKDRWREEGQEKRERAERRKEKEGMGGKRWRWKRGKRRRGSVRDEGREGYPSYIYNFLNQLDPHLKFHL